MKSIISQAFNLFILLTLFSCSSNKSEKERSYSNSNSEQNSNEISGENSTYHTDSRYKYEYRTGSSGNYEYNYDINGMDEDGNYVSGNVSMNGKYGDGYIETDNGDQIDIEAEWIGSGEIEATDADGNVYDLEVD